MQASPAGTTATAAGGQLTIRGKSLFDSNQKAKLIRDELRSLCPRNAELINVEPTRVEEKAPADLETV